MINRAKFIGMLFGTLFVPKKDDQIVMLNETISFDHNKDRHIIDWKVKVEDGQEMFYPIYNYGPYQRKEYYNFDDWNTPYHVVSRNSPFEPFS